MNPKRAGIMALVEAYKLLMKGSPDIPSDDVLAREMLQRFERKDGRNVLALMLDDVPGEVQLKPSALIELLQTAFEADLLKQQLEQWQTNAIDAWKAMDEARGIMADERQGTPAQRQSKALKRLGLLHGERGKGRVNPKYQKAANYYFSLRCGDHLLIDGVLILQEKRTHEEAVREVCEKFHLEWATLERMWRRHGIEVEYNAPIYDAPNVHRHGMTVRTNC